MYVVDQMYYGHRQWHAPLLLGIHTLVWDETKTVCEFHFRPFQGLCLFVGRASAAPGLFCAAAQEGYIIFDSYVEIEPR